MDASLGQKKLCPSYICVLYIWLIVFRSLYKTLCFSKTTKLFLLNYAEENKLQWRHKYYLLSDNNCLSLCKIKAPSLFISCMSNVT